MSPNTARPTSGSSPLTRGKPQRRPREARRLGLIPTHAGKTIRASITFGSVRRLIPTHAGKTSSDSSSAQSEKAHPHSRGENLAGHPNVLRDRGSSPLTRGKQFDLVLRATARRLIPTHAGKTIPRQSTARRSPAHPHSRGENAARSSDPLRPPGSSPLTRGKLSSARRPSRLIGLIPTHAGKT